MREQHDGEPGDQRERWRLRNEQKKKAIEGLEVTGRNAVIFYKCNP